MKRILTTLFITVLFHHISSSQNFIDTIVLKGNDTIKCRITLINDVNVFYREKDYNEQEYKSLNEVIYYSWLSKDSVFTDKNFSSFKQYGEKYKWRLGLSATHQYCNPFYYTSIALNFNKKNHLVYLGPSLNSLKEDFYGDSDLDFSSTKFGLNFGYRYILSSGIKKSNFYLQMDFTLHKEVYYTKTPNYGWPTWGPQYCRNEFVALENYMSIGYLFKVNSFLDLYAGAGIGAPNFFAFAIENPIPCYYLGLSSNFKHKKN